MQVVQNFILPLMVTEKIKMEIVIGQICGNMELIAQL
jgi:hypothetical protein